MGFEPTSVAGSTPAQGTVSKRCTKCSAEKPPDEFPYKHEAKGTRQAICKACMRAQSKTHYENNRQVYFERNRRRTSEARAYLREWKGRPCEDCGDVFPYQVMDPHHRDPSQRVGTASKIAMEGNLPALKRELAKCDLLCANCHRIRHRFDS